MALRETLINLFMRVVIRSCSDKKFFAAKEHWVARRDEALDFVSSVAALNVATRLRLEDIEIVLDFGKGASDVVLEVPRVTAVRPPRPDAQ